MENKFDKKFTAGSLLIFAVPNIIMMLFLSLYTIVDGIFVSRFVGELALSATNMVYPIINIQLAISIMIATGGSAIVAIRMGEGRDEYARGIFTFLTIVELVLGLATLVIGLVFIDPILVFLGTTPVQYQMAKEYIIILLSFTPFFHLQIGFQTFFVTAGRPGLGLVATILGGITNIILDYVFIVILKMGVAGAAWATGMGYVLPTIIGLIYFSRKEGNVLHFSKPIFDREAFIKSCTNGSSEMVTNLANAVTTILFNYIFLKYYGEEGVASITIILYFQFIFLAIFFGYSGGVAPIISYKYGNGDKKQLKKVYKISILFVVASSFMCYLLSNLLIENILRIFTTAGNEVYNITKGGFGIFSISFLLMGVSIFASSLFTALSDGKVSAIISFSRTFLFLVMSILILPYYLGEPGIWLAVPIAEGLGVLVTIYFLFRYKDKYSYM